MWIVLSEYGEIDRNIRRSGDQMQGMKRCLLYETINIADRFVRLGPRQGVYQAMTP